MKIIFYLYIPQLRDYKEELFLKIQNKDKTKYQLTQRIDLHEDVFSVEITTENNDEIEYLYKIEKGYSCKLIKRHLNRYINKMANDNTEIQFFDTPNQFIQKKFLRQDFVPLKQNDIKNALLMFVQNQSCTYLLKGLHSFIQASNFENKEQLKHQVFQKAFQQMEQILESPNLFMDRYEMFKEQILKSQVKAVSRLLQKVLIISNSEEMFKRVQKAIQDAKNGFSFQELFQETMEKNDLFSEKELVEEIQKKIRNRSDAQLADIKEKMKEQFSLLDDKALEIFQESIIQFWSKCWSHMGKQSSNQRLKYLIEFQQQMKFVQLNSQEIEQMFKDAKNQSYSMKRDFFNYLLLKIKVFLESYDKEAKIINHYSWQFMQPDQSKKMLEIMKEIQIIPQIEPNSFWKEIVVSFKDFEEMKPYFELLNSTYKEFITQDNLIVSFQAIIDQIPSKNFLVGIDLIYQMLNFLSERIPQNSNYLKKVVQPQINVKGQEIIDKIAKQAEMQADFMRNFDEEKQGVWEREEQSHRINEEDFTQKREQEEKFEEEKIGQYDKEDQEEQNTEEILNLMEVKMQEIIQKKISQINLNDLLEGIDQNENWLYNEKYYQILELSIKRKIEIQINKGFDFFEIYEKVQFKLDILNENDFQKKSYFQMVKKIIEKSALLKYNEIKEQSNQLSSPFTVKLLEKLPHCQDIIEAIQRDVTILKEKIDQLNIFTIEKMVLNQPNLRIVFNFFQQILLINYENFSEIISHNIKIYNEERKKLIVLFQAFENYFPEQEKRIFVTYCVEDVQFGSMKKIIEVFISFREIYEFFFVFNDNTVFKKIMNFYREQITEENSNTLTQLFFEIKKALNSFADLFQKLNPSANSMPSEDFLTSFSISISDNQNSQNISCLFPEGVSTLSILFQLLGSDYEQMLENANSLLTLMKCDSLQSTASDLIEIIAKIQFFIKAKECIIQLAEQFELDLSNEGNAEFLNQLEIFTNPNENFQNKSILDICSTFQIFKHFDVGHKNDQSIEFIPNLHEILNYSQNRLQSSFLEMRDLIDDDDTESMSLLIKLDSLNPLIKDLLRFKEQMLPKRPLVSDLIINLLQVTRRHIKDIEIVANINECCKNFYKISEVSSSYAKKKSYFTVIKQIVSIGKFIFSDDPLGKESVNLIIKCSKQKYSEEEIRQICSRVILEQNSNTSIAIKAELKQNMIPQSKNKIPKKKQSPMSSMEVEQDNDEQDEKIRQQSALESLNESINQFKEQWFEVEELKKGILELLEFGYYQILSKKIEFSNDKNNYQKCLKKMQSECKSLKIQLSGWKKEIEEVFQKYPAFSLIGFKHYGILQRVIEENFLDLDNFDEDLYQILKKMGTSAEVFGERVNQEKMEGNKWSLEKLAEFLCSNFEYPQQVNQVFDEFEEENKITSVGFPNSQSLLLFLISRVSQLDRPVQYYQYFFYTKNSTNSDFELFIQRVKYFTDNKSPFQFFLIFNSKIESTFYQNAQELLSKLIKSNNLFNKLYLLIEEINQEKYFPEIQRVYKSSQPLINYESPFFKECSNKVQFFYSQFPGSGKTFEIQRNKSKGGQVRVPTSSSEDKSSFLENLQTNFIDFDDAQSFHLDLYETEMYDLNFILFEMIFLRSISIHNYCLLLFDPKVQIYVEIANTLEASLKQNLHIIKHFNIQEVKFDMAKFDDCSSFKNQSQLESQYACFKYLDSLNKCGFIEEKGINSLKSFDLDLNDISLDPIDKEYFSNMKNLIEKYIIQDIYKKGQKPCFYQIQRFIDLFGSEMIKLNKSIYFSKEYSNPEFFRDGIRSQIVTLNFTLCKLISLTQRTNNDKKINLIKDKDQILDIISKSILPFSKCKVNFLTFQEEGSCITSFFDKEEQVPKVLKQLFSLQQSDMIYFDSQNSPENLLNWLVRLINKNEVSIYLPGKSKSFDQIKNKNLKELVQRISVQKDNFFKIASIYLKIRANIPLIIMGEAGIGKTVLVEFMASIMEANFKTMIIHTGITEKQVEEFVNEGIAQNKESDQKVILFFDEVNTSNMVGGLFKEILVDKHLKGKPIPLEVIPIAAINPYKLKSERQKEMLNKQIHGGIKKNMIKKIKNTNLEYMVCPLPESMYSLIWNFDSLSQEDEFIYISSMVKIKMDLQINLDPSIKCLFNESQQSSISKTIFLSHQLIRQEMGYVSSCSLRDVARYLKLFFWLVDFLKKYNNFREITHLNISESCPCLAFYITYCVRLPINEQRFKYLEQISLLMKKDIKDFQNIIDTVQRFFIDQCDVPPGIVKNSALRQNVFTLFASIINKIPVVLIGPPGSSKTQSIRILIQSMKGSNSRTKFLKQFQVLIPLFYQGHVQSTSERILEVFEKANEKQDRLEKDKQTDKYISLVYIEELGLAEISPHNPLKVLHSTLENPRISVACISNWPLDQSKMNRMTSIIRMDTTPLELEEIFKHIWKEYQKLPTGIIDKRIDCLIQDPLPKQIALTYKIYLGNLMRLKPQFENFHGMRDFYGMVKLLCYEEIQLAGYELNPLLMEKKQLSQKERVVLSFFRHFSGLDQEALEILKDALKVQNLYEETNPKMSRMDNSLSHISNHLTETQTPEFIPRHLMIIAENVSHTIEFVKSNLRKNKRQVKTLIGGDFSDEINAERIFDIINEIVSCVEQGIVLIITNLDSVYQSLYELLNQSYRYFNGKNYCKISFGSDSNNIEVSPDFKLILVVQQSQISRMDGPLLNRFEKHLLTQSMIISQKSQECINRAIEHFSSIRQIFSFPNLEEIVSSLVISKEFKKERTNYIQIIEEMYHLGNLGQILCSNNESVQQHKEFYFKSGLHYNLDTFITNFINLKKEKQGLSYAAIFSPSQFISTYTLRDLNTIYLSQSSSSKQLESNIKNFFQGLSTQTLDSDNPPILALIAQLEESSSKILFIQQKIEELVSINNDLSFCLILLIVTVKDNFEMIPFFGQWNQFYIEDLKPLNFINEIELQQQFNLEEWLSDLNQPLQSSINYELVIEKFLQGSDNIAISYSRIKYKESSSGYSLDRLKKLQKLFSSSSQKHEKQIKAFLQHILFLKFQHAIRSLQISSLNSFIQEYVMKRGFLNQSKSFSTSIWRAFNDIIADSLMYLIYFLEKNNLTYSISEASQRSQQYMQYITSQLFQFLGSQDQENTFFSSFDEQYISPLEESKDVFLQCSIKAFEKVEGLIKACSLTWESIEDVQQIEENWRERFQEHEISDFYEYQEEATIDFQKNNTFKINSLQMKLIDLLLPVNSNPKSLNFISYLIVYPSIKREIELISELMKEFEWIETIDILSKGFKGDGNGNTIAKQFGVFLVNKIYSLIESKLIKNMKNNRVNIISQVQYLISFIYSMEIQGDLDVEYSLQQLQIYQIFLRLFIKQGDKIHKVLSQINLSKFNSDLTSLDKLKKSLFKLLSKDENLLENWAEFVIELLLNSLNSLPNLPFKKACQMILHYLIQIELDQTKIQNKLIIKSNLLISELVLRLKEESELLELFFDEETENKMLNDLKIDSSSSILVIFQSVLQSTFIKQKLENNKQKSELTLILLSQKNLAFLTPLQQVIYFAVFREVCKLAIESIENKSMPLPLPNSIQQYFSSISDKRLQIYVSKLFYFRYKNGQSMLQSMSNSFYFRNSKWLVEYSLPFISLLDSSFMDDNQKDLFKKYFSSSKPWKEQLRGFIDKEIKSSRNVFGQLNNGEIQENSFYPFMMLNNICLFHRDSQQNTQLYQCLNCQEYIFSNACEDLQSQVQCQKCQKLIAKNSQYTRLAVRQANVNQQLLAQEEQNNQWRGYYIMLEEDQENFKLSQGSSIDLRIFSLLYNFSLLLASETKKYRSQEKVQIYNRSSKSEIPKTIQTFNKILKVNYFANSNQFLQDQITCAIDHLTKVLKQLHNMNEQEMKITVFICLLNLLKNDQIQAVQTVALRSQLNQSLSTEISNIFMKSKEVLLVHSKGSHLIPLILEKDTAQNSSELSQFQINLRQTGKEITPKYVIDFIYDSQRKEDFQILKELLNISKFSYISNSLIVLITFSQLIQQQLSKKFTSKSAQQITLLEALNNDKGHPIYQFFLKQLIPIWEKIREKEKEFAIGCKTTKIQLLNEKSKLSDLVLSVDRQYGFFTNVLELLVSQQNNIIQRIVSLVKDEKNLEESHSPLSVIIEQLFVKGNQENQTLKERTIELIDPQVNILRSYNPICLKKYMTNSIEYSKGETLIYDLNYLEEELAKQMLYGITFISIEKSQNFYFLKEISQINILNIDIPQEPIPKQISEEIKQYLKTSQDGIDLRIKLSTIFFIFKSEINSANLSIKDAFDLVKIQAPSGKICSILQQSLTLKHIRELIVIFEDYYMESLVESCNPIYKKDISQLKFQQTLAFLLKNKMEQDFCKVLGRFIIRCLSQNQDSISSEQKLFEQLFDSLTYDEFWDDSSQLNDLHSQASKDATTIGQSYFFYKELVKFNSKKLNILNNPQYSQTYQKQHQQKRDDEEEEESMFNLFTDKKQKLGEKRNYQNNNYP